MNNKNMVLALKSLVVPVLRERSFKGSFPHFRRFRERHIDLLTIQFDKWGGGYIIEVSCCGPDGIVTHWGEHIPPQRVRAWDLDHRHRLGSPGPGVDGRWFRFDSSESCEQVARNTLPYLEEAEEWWANNANCP